MMRMMFVLIAIVAAFVMMPIEQSRADNTKSGRYLVGGFGVDSCGNLLQAFTRNPPGYVLESEGQIFYTQTSAYIQWINGYVSSHSVRHGAPTKDFEMDGMVMWVKKYCEDNPTDQIFKAASAFTKAHFKAR